MVISLRGVLESGRGEGLTIIFLFFMYNPFKITKWAYLFQVQIQLLLQKKKTDHPSSKIT